MGFQLTYTVPGKKSKIPIYTGADVFNKILSVIKPHAYSSILVILDENVAHHWSARIKKILSDDATYLPLPSGEKNKTLHNVEKIWTLLSEKRFDRKSLIINIGGGMICDIGAFAASTYMRGIAYIQIPTTLLAQADAAIGGKTGFNFNQLKNTIGTFSEPVAIFSDTSFLTTLPKREFNSGLAEIIKHAIIADAWLFTYMLKKKKSSLSKKEIDKILLRSTSIKCEVVEQDPFEKKQRKKLNFGHTIGHAIEMAAQNSSNPLLHGEAVAIGMIAEARMSFLSGYISRKKFKDIETLIGNAGLPNRVSASYKASILKKIASDKKNVGKQINWVFLKDIGKVKVDMSLPEKIVSESIDYILK